MSPLGNMPERNQEDVSLPVQTDELSEAWGLVSDCLVGIPITDNRWKRASDWLQKNRAYQTIKGKLPEPSWFINRTST